jgi:hypothetical protein
MILTRTEMNALGNFSQNLIKFHSAVFESLDMCQWMNKGTFSDAP